MYRRTGIHHHLDSDPKKERILIGMARNSETGVGKPTAMVENGDHMLSG